MKKKKVNNKVLFFAVVLIAGIAVALFTLYNGEEVMSILHYDSNDVLIGKESLILQRSVLLSQSLFGEDKVKVPFRLQAAAPYDESSDSTIIFRAEVDNPFQEKAQLLFATMYKNGVKLGDKKFIQLYIEPGELYTYESEPIDLTGINAERNVLTVIFTFETDEGQRAETTYEYLYLSLIKCVGDNQCPYDTPECDIDNKAKFSDDKNVYYCVKPCNNNVECPIGQLCFFGACGY